jgi:hypothetical protein
VSHVDTLKSLESLLASFLEQAVALSHDRIPLSEGLNRLDGITRRFVGGEDLTDEIGNWFAEHRDWLDHDDLQPAVHDQVTDMLAQIQRQIHASPQSSPATEKIAGEITRWSEHAGTARQKLVLKRGPEAAHAAAEGDTIAPFGHVLDRISRLFADISGRKQHLLSALDDALKAASLQGSREALLLSALIIYYLKQSSYKVEPYVKRLREAESLFRGGGSHV